METKFIIGIVVALVIIGGVVGCNYMINNPAQPANEQKTVAAENQQNTTNETANVTKNESNDNTQKANATTKTVKKICIKCGGDGKILCSACGGDGCKKVDCPDCSGPEKPDTVKACCCTTCNGYGVLTETCKACGGDGKILCSACGGDGYNWITVTQ